MKEETNNKKILLLHMIFFAVVIPMLTTSCSGGGGSGNSVDTESIYSPGASVGAQKYSDSRQIELQLQDGSGNYSIVQDGQFIEGGRKILRAIVDGDQTDIDRVFFSDGAKNQVEAVSRGGFFEAEYDFDGKRLYNSLLIQAIHKNGRASKEKIVFRTFKDTGEGRIILDGIGVLAANDILSGNRHVLEQRLDSIMKQAFADITIRYPEVIPSLSYGDDDPSTSDIEVSAFHSVDNPAYPSTVVHVSFIVHDVDMTAVNIKGQGLITTRDNDLVVDLHVDVNDQGKNNRRCLVFNLAGSPSATFQKDFMLRSTFEEIIGQGLSAAERSPLAAELNDLWSALENNMPLSLEVNGSEVDISTLLDKQNMDLSRYLFIDLYGVPLSTTDDVLALGAGVYIAAPGSGAIIPPPVSPADSSDLDAIIRDLCQVMVDKAFDNIKDQYGMLISTLTYGDANPDTTDFIINWISIQDATSPAVKMVRTNFTVKSVDFSAIKILGQSVINTRDNDLTVDASFLLSSGGASADATLTLDVQEVSDVSFHDSFAGRTAVEGLASYSLAHIDTITTGIDAIISAISVDFDLSRYGYLGPEFPDVADELSVYAWGLSLPDGCNLSLQISQDNVNHVLAQLFKKGLEWDINEIVVPLLGNDFAGFDDTADGYKETVMRFNVPPVIDMRSSEIEIQVDDISIEYRINNEPQWEASVDLGMVMDVQLRDNELAFFVTPRIDKCNFHIMKDNIGNLGLFDHSSLVYDLIIQLPKMLGGEVGEPMATMNLSSLEPLITLNRLGNPIAVRAENGYLTINMDALDVDLSVLSGIFSQ